MTPELFRKQRRQFASLQSKLRKIHRLGSARWRHIVRYRQGRLWERLWILGRLATYHPWPNSKALALGSQTAKALRQARSAYQAVVKSAPQRSPSPYNLLAETRLRALTKPAPLVYIRDLQRRVRHKGANRILLRHGPTVLRPLLGKKLRRTLVVWLDCPPSAAQLQLERWLLRRQRRAHGAIPVVRLLTEKACIGKPRPNPHGSARIAREAGLLSSHVFLVKGDGSLAAFLGAWLNTKRKRLALVKALKLLLPIPRGPSPEQLRLQRQGRRALTLAQAQARKGSLGVALRHVERAVGWLPRDSQDDARRLRALLKARRGDLSGALKDVAWWRQRYGEVSAEELMDEVRKARGGPGR